MVDPYRDQPPAQQPQRQRATELSSAPVPSEPSAQYHHEPAYPPNAPRPGYPGARSLPPVPGRYPPHPQRNAMLPMNPSGYQAHDALPPPVGYHAQTAQSRRANSVAQFLADAARVLTRPSVASFDAVQSHARLAPVLLGVLLIGGAYAVAGSILTPVVGLLGGLLGAFLGFFSGIGMAMLVAKALGGVGRFTTYAYTIAIVDVPLAIVDAASLLVPPFTGLVFLLGIAYGSYLGILATASVHRLSIGKSVLVYLVSLLLKVFIPLCAIATIVVVLLYALASHQ